MNIQIDNQNMVVKPKDNIIKKGLIYIIEHNTNSELRYIGQSKESLKKRWSGHLTTFKMFDKMFYRLGFFVNYYGVENFSIREYKMYNNITQDFLDSEERKYIYDLGTLNTQHSNDNITIKMTNELQNEFVGMLIQRNIQLTDINTVIHNFEYNYRLERLDFILAENIKMLLEELK
jgi:hypothetical protein